jgi:hypothetical protein
VTLVRLAATNYGEAGIRLDAQQLLGNPRASKGRLAIARSMSTTFWRQRASEARITGRLRPKGLYSVVLVLKGH